MANGQSPRGSRQLAFAAVCAAVPILVLGAAWAVGEGGEEATAGGGQAALVKLAVVDLDKVFAQSEEWQDYQRVVMLK